MKTHDFFREPPRDFGKAAKERQLLKNGKKKKIYKDGLASAPVIGISCYHFLLWASY